MANKILICGLNGAGKSTLGKGLAQRLGWKFLDIEDYYFPQDNTDYNPDNMRTEEEVIVLLAEDMKKYSDILFASVKGNVGKEVLSMLTGAIFMHVPKEVSMRRVRERAYKRFGDRILPGGNLHEQEEKFFRMIEMRREKEIAERVEQLGVAVIHVDGTEPTENNIQKIERILTGQQGYGVFGKAYGVMLKNDLHAAGSIDHKLMEEMILLNKETYALLYNETPKQKDMQKHELFLFAQQFRGGGDYQTIENVLHYTANMAANFHVAFEKMEFGGTEKEIIERGTDWCADMARVGAVLLGCNGIPARIVHLANPKKAYNGHVVTEAFYEGKYGVCDFLYGYCFYEKKPIDTYELMQKKQYLETYPEDYAALYLTAAISEYDPMENNNYDKSTANEYYLNLINSNHNDKWIMQEDL